jgi:preprotein translocase subunit YajC
MYMNLLAEILAQAPAATTGSNPSPASGATQQSPLSSLIFVVPMIVIFYFLLIRPQQKQAKRQAAMLKTLKSGDRVITTSGIIGVVVSVKDNTVTLRSADTKLELNKVAVTEILNSDTPAAS